MAAESPCLCTSEAGGTHFTGQGINPRAGVLDGPLAAFPGDLTYKSESGSFSQPQPRNRRTRSCCQLSPRPSFWLCHREREAVITST